jgi:type VI secretion system (T6SS) effector TldE1-like protein
VGCAALKLGGRGLLVRVGVASVAAGLAGLTCAFSLCAGIMLGSRYGTAVLPADVPGAAPARAAHPANATFDARWAAGSSSDTPTTPASVPASFDNRFASSAPAPRTRSLQPPLAFSDRFAGATASGAPPAQFALASVPATVQPAPTVAPARAPRAAARALLARVAPKPQALAPYRVASLGDATIRTAYAPADAANRDAAIDNPLLEKMTPRDPAPKDAATPPDTSHTAIYDITAHVVYLPNGRRLEAHSGLADHMDDLGSVSLRDLGPTPPGVYDLTMREASFHGIEAIRLNPVDNAKMYGRDGILAHPYMLGPNGQSNGCLSLKDYDEFLAAFRRGEFNRLLVVERLDNAPAGQTATGWIAEKLRGLFGRS